MLYTELIIRAVAMLFQTLSLYDFLLRSYITGKLRTNSIIFSSNSSLQLMVYKTTIAVNKQQLFLLVVTRLMRRHAEVKAVVLKGAGF